MLGKAYCMQIVINDLVKLLEYYDTCNILINNSFKLDIDTLIVQVLHSLFCPNKCGVCQHCRFIMDNIHPDLLLIKKAEYIKQIRDIHRFLALTRHYDKYKVVCLDITYLSSNAANALLKLLEEHPANTKFILITENVNTILPTVLSRCYLYNLRIQEQPLLMQLELNDIVLKALYYPSINNISAVLDDIGKDNYQHFIKILGRWLLSLLEEKLSNNISNEFSTYIDKIKLLTIKIVDLNKLFAIYDELVLRSNGSNINYKLQCEHLLLQYQSLFVV